MKSTKQSLAEQWELGYRLGRGCRIKHGFPFKGEKMTTEDDDSLPIVVNIVNFDYSGGFRFDSTKIQRYKGVYPTEYELSPREILLVMTCQTPRGEILGIPGRIPDDGRIYLHNQRMGLVRITDSEALDPSYLYYLFLTRGFNQHLFSTSTGAKILHTAPERIERFLFDRPPLGVQARIGRTLSYFDDLIENNRRRVQILEEMARAIYREWFVHFRFPGHEEVEMVDSEMGEIPDGWKLLPFTSLGEFQNGYPFAPRHWQKQGKPIVKIAEMKNGIGGTTSYYHGKDIPEEYHIDTGDLLFAWSASLCVEFWTGGEALLNQHIFRVLPKNGYSRAFLFHSIENKIADFQSKTQGTTMRHIRRSALDEVLLSVPPTEHLLQFDAVVVPITDLRINLEVTNKTLSRTRDLLLPKLVSGEIDVSNLDIGTTPQNGQQTSKYKQQSTLDKWTDGDGQDADMER